MDILSVSSMDAELQSEPHPDTFYDDLLVSLSNASFGRCFFCTLRRSSPRCSCIYMLSMQGIYNMSIPKTLLHVLGPVYASFVMLQLIC